MPRGPRDAQRRCVAQGADSAPRPRSGERGSRGGEHVYRINLQWAGEDPRLALREELPDDEECAEIARKTAVLDRRLGEGWTRETLEWIG